MPCRPRNSTVTGLACCAAVLLAGCGTPPEGLSGAVPPTAVATTSKPPALHPPANRHENPGQAWARKKAGNNAWQQHHDLSPEQQRIADTAAERLRPGMERLRAAGDFTERAVRQVLTDAGLHPEMVVSDTDKQDAQPPHAAFWSSPQSGICVDGKLTPDSVVITTEGPSLDGGCTESGGGH